MAGLNLLTILLMLGGAAAGGLVSWIIRSKQSAQALDRLGNDWQSRHEQAVAKNKELKAEIAKLQYSVEAAKKIVEKHIVSTNQAKTEIASLRERQNALQKNLFVVGAERDELKNKMSNHSSVSDAARQRISQLQAELEKNQQVFKVKLEAGAAERNALQRKIEDAKSEQKSLNNLLNSARAEYQSVSNLLASAQTKLENLNAMEKEVIALEADNAELKHETMLAAQRSESMKRELGEFTALKEQNKELVQYLKAMEKKVIALEGANAELNRDTTLAAQRSESMKRELGELTELKEQNKELVQCLRAMENRCKQYEDDARRYRNQYEESEKESDTLRFKMGDIERNFHEMQRAEKKEKKAGNGKAAIKVEPNVLATSAAQFGMPKPKGEVDDLTEIIGIGKVFERTLHDMGIWYFRQIAAFGPGDIGRINAELKEFKGRIEHDDWIGQAKELHFKKYGDKQ